MKTKGIHGIVRVREIEFSGPATTERRAAQHANWLSQKYHPESPLPNPDLPCKEPKVRRYVSSIVSLFR